MDDVEQTAVQPRKKRRIEWRSFLLEAFFVALGVALALAADSWRESLKQKQRAAVALTSIREEIEANRKAVRESLDYHLHLTETLRAFALQARQEGKQGTARYPSGGVFSQGFVKPAQVLSTAWETANATDVTSHMKYADVLALARTYNRQEHYEGQSDQVRELIYTRLFDEGFQGIVRGYVNLNSIISTMWYRECELLASYAEVSAQLDPSRGAASPELPEACKRGAR